MAGWHRPADPGAPAVPFVSQRLGTIVSSENADDLVVVSELIESGQVMPVIDRTYPLSEVAAAIRHLLAGHARGKVEISVRDHG